MTKYWALWLPKAESFKSFYHMAEQKQDDQLKHTYSSSVRIWDVALKTCQRRWTIGRSGKRRSGISVLVARHDDDHETNVLFFRILIFWFSFYVFLNWFHQLFFSFQIIKIISDVKSSNLTQCLQIQKD